MNEQLVVMEQERAEGRLVVRLRGEIDLSNVEQLEQRLGRAVEGFSVVVVDLSAIEYIDSQGLRLLTRLSRRLSTTGSDLELVAPKGSIARDVLEMTGLSQDIAIRETPV
jgi:anti-anti-sigma factor